MNNQRTIASPNLQPCPVRIYERSNQKDHVAQFNRRKSQSMENEGGGEDSGIELLHPTYNRVLKKETSDNVSLWGCMS